MTTFQCVEPAQIDDAVVLLRAQFDEHEIGVSDETLARSVRELVLIPSRGALLLAREATPVGIAALAFTWTLEHGGLVAWLDELYVVPRERGRGVGRDLLAAAIEVSRAAGCLAVELEVEADHARAERLYAREGFEPLKRARWVRRL